MTVWCNTPSGHFVVVLRMVIAKIEILAKFAKNAGFEILPNILTDVRRLN